MLLIPLGPENRELRSFPVVSVGIACALVLLFVVSGPHTLPDSWNEKVEARARRLEALLWESPLLVLAPRVEGLLGAGTRAELQRRREEEKRRPAGERRFTLSGQDDLDRASRDLLSALEESTTWSWGYVPAAPSLLTGFTSMFLHGNWMHLFGNLLFFLAVAPFLEDVFGHVLFSVLYLASGLVAAFIHGAVEHASWVPLIGASGAIAGLMGAFLVRLGTTRIRFLFLPVVLLPFIRVPFRLSAAIVLPVWFSFQVLMADTPGLETNVALWAHIGGFLFGIAVAAAFRFANLERRWGGAAAEREPAPSAADTTGALARDLQHSFGSDGPERTAQVADRLLAALVRQRDAGRARDLIVEMRGRLGDRLSPRFLLSAARFHEDDGDVPEALALYQEVADRFPADPLAIPALVRIATILESRGNARGVRDAHDRAARHPQFSPSWDAAFRQIAARAPARR